MQSSHKARAERMMKKIMQNSKSFKLEKKSVFIYID